MPWKQLVPALFIVGSVCPIFLLFISSFLTIALTGPFPDSSHISINFPIDTNLKPDAPNLPDSPDDAPYTPNADTSDEPPDST